MAPTKNVTDLAQKVVKKNVRKAKPMKPPLKTPTCITVKIPNSGCKPPKIARKVTFQKKIELANEVALKQLMKLSDSSNILLSPVTTEAKVAQLTMEQVKTGAKIKPTPTRKKKPTTKLTSEESSSDNTPLAKKVVLTFPSVTGKPKRKSKPSLKVLEIEASSTPSKSPTKQKFCNDATTNESEKESSQDPIKKPGPKSKTINTSLTKNKPVVKLETSLDISLLDIKKKIVKPRSVTKGKARPRKMPQQKIISDYFSDGTVNGEADDNGEVIPKTPVKRVYKRKQKLKKLENETKDPKSTEETAETRRRPRVKLVNERLTNNNSKVTRSSNKGKCMNAKEIQTAAAKLEDALAIRAAPVQARSNSLNSCNSNLSWTREISTASSDTTTCVTVSSNDFVRFDKKLPFVKIQNPNLDRLKVIEDSIERKLLENDSTSSGSDSESSDTSSSDLDVTASKPELNLSTSSLTTSPRSEGAPDNTKMLCLEMDKLNNSLKTFYADMGKWMVFDTDDSETFSDILEAMDLEKYVMSNCENFSSILDTVKCVTMKASPGNPSPAIAGRSDETVCEDAQFSKDSDGVPDTVNLNKTDVFSKPSSVKSRDKFPVNVAPAIAVQITPDKCSPGKSTGSCKTFTNDNYNYVSFDDRNYDDEDALSLYAESITSMESSKLSSFASISNMSVQEPYVVKPTPRLQDAYIPKPTRPWLLERYTYRPTRIEKQTRIDDIPLKTIEPKMIEKQNADSSSISKEMNLNKRTMDLLKDGNRLSSLAEGPVNTIETEQANKPHRIFAQYLPANAVKSAIYRGYCFFHLASQCKNIVNCRFPHEDIDPNILKCRLTVLSEDNIIEEYLLTCNFNNLRRKYGLLFIQECKRRDSTRILMEMAIDLGLGVVEWEDNNLIVNVLETTLLHLNQISFDACDDLLRFEHDGRMMCDALLSCMADSQNFAQFKRAFVKLANFMAQIKRPVVIDVVGNILERVCILPCEDSLARGMLCLMKNTETRIFENCMIKSFEVQLSNIESDVHEAYLVAKKEAIEVQLAEQEAEFTPASPGQSSVPRVVREGPRDPSPDTTNLDSLKKVQMAQVTTFKRTIDTEAIRHLFKSPANPAPKQRFTIPRGGHWRRRIGYSMRSGRQHNSRMPIGRSVYRTQTVCTEV